MPCKGSFNVQDGKELHKRAPLFAAAREKKPNTVVNDALEQYLDAAIACA
jgi:predicted HicB family RNase H-like nuclease